MITGAVLARNEASNIVACLQTLGRFVDEVILIDMESSDETVSLAAPHVDRIIPHPYQEAFDSARNVVIPFAKYDWLWFLDADERVPDATGKMVRDLIAQRADEFEALLIPFRTYFAGKWIQHSGWWPGYTMPRVLKRGYFRFATEVHGGVELNGRQLATPADPELAIEHHSYRDISHYLEKFNRYTSLESTKLTPDAFRWEDGVRQMVRDLWGYYERNEGILDGMHGWILAWLAGQYRWFSHAKLLDRDRESASQQAPPPAIDDVIREMQEELLRIRQGERQDKLALRIHSPIADPSGYAEEARFFIEAMARGDRPMSLRKIDPAVLC